jgi:hypothetical protein
MANNKDCKAKECKREARTVVGTPPPTKVEEDKRSNKKAKEDKKEMRGWQNVSDYLSEK